MNLIHKSIKYVSRGEVFIPFEGKMKSCLKEGTKFEKGVELFQVERRKLLASYSVSEELGVKPNKILDLVGRIEGEYISKNDVIAEKLISGGLMSKRILSDYDGIINFSKADLGYVNILSELGLESCVSTFGGIVKSVDFARGIFVKTDTCKVPLFYSNYSFEEDIFGQFQILTDAESIPASRVIQESFDGKVVFAGRFMYPELALELFKRGCKFILVGSMNYDDLKDLNVPVGVLTGFGNIFFDSIRLSFFKELKGFQVGISSEGVQFPIGLNDEISRLFEQNCYTNSIKKNDIVKSVDFESFGLVGEVQNVNEVYATVLMQEGSTYVIDVDSLELYNEEFSVMRTRIF